MKKDIGQLVGEIYATLKGLTPEDSQKVLSSVNVLLGVVGLQQTGDVRVPQTAITRSQNDNSVLLNGNNAKVYFDNKSPQNKGEEFAVAAMYRQENKMGEVHTAETLKEIIKAQAKRKFDDKNFARDIQNAIRQAKLFMGGGFQRRVHPFVSWRKICCCVA